MSLFMFVSDHGASATRYTEMMTSVPFVLENFNYGGEEGEEVSDSDEKEEVDQTQAEDDVATTATETVPHCTVVQNRKKQ